MWEASLQERIALCKLEDPLWRLRREVGPVEDLGTAVLQRVSELFAQQEQRVAQLTPRRTSTFVIDWVWVIDRWVLVV